MDIGSLANALDTPSVLAWFALLIVVFAVFVGLGIYQTRRSEALERAAAEPRPTQPPRASRARPGPGPSNRKEYT